MEEQQLTSLSPRHLRMMDYILAGWQYTEIAKVMNCTTQNIYITKKQRIFQDELAQRRAILDDKVQDGLSNSVSNSEYINKTLSDGARKAAEKLCSFVDGTEECSPSIARQSASDILDRAGYPKVTKTENTQNTIFVLDADDLARIEKTIELDIEVESTEIKSETESEIVTDGNFEADTPAN